MPKAMIAPMSFRQVRYTMPEPGMFEFVVNSDLPVTTFVVDEEGLREFLDNEPEIENYYGGAPARRRVHQQVEIPFQGRVYLLIINENDEPSRVNYSVYL